MFWGAMIFYSPVMVNGWDIDILKRRAEYRDFETKIETLLIL
jgi:hypothetical protein